MTINPAFWIEAIRIALHTADCDAKKRTLTNSADHLERHIAQQDGHIHALSLAAAEAARKARLWDDLTAAREAPHTDEDDGWKRLVREGRVMEAVKACRALHGYGLTEARHVVEAYQAARITPAAQESEP